MFYSQQDAQEFTIPGGTHGYLYPPHPKKEQSVATIEMDGVYPEKGFSINDVCTETIFVLEGELEVEYKGEWHTLKPHDMIMLEPNNTYRIKGKGKAMVIISPSWDSNQNHIIEA